MSILIFYHPTMKKNNTYVSKWRPYVANQKWEYLSLAVGYAKARDTAIVEIEDITFEPLTDKEGHFARFSVSDDDEAKLDANGEYCFWLAVFHLGKVVEVHRK